MGSGSWLDLQMMNSMKQSTAAANNQSNSAAPTKPKTSTHLNYPATHQPHLWGYTHLHERLMWCHLSAHHAGNDTCQLLQHRCRPLSLTSSRGSSRGGGAWLSARAAGELPPPCILSAVVDILSGSKLFCPRP
jgi:hypothetical protein